MSKKKPSFDVAPNGDKWKVQQHGSSRASKNFEKQSDAIIYGKERAKQDKTELYIKNRKGKIREANSYGKDPFPPKG